MDFEEIYRRYFGDVYRYLLRLSGSETAAEDITSETFLRAMQALPRFRGDCDVRVWLCRIARNTYFSTRRDPDNQPMEEPGEERAGSAPSPEEETLRREELLLQLLPPGGVGEVPGAHQSDALFPGPQVQVGQVAVPAGGPGVAGVDVQVRVKHRAPPVCFSPL